MKCTNCSKEIPDGKKFCKFCGAPQKTAEPSGQEKPVTRVTPDVKQKPAESVKSAASSTIEYSSKVVSKGIARWHTVFLLIFGIACLLVSIFLSKGIAIINNPEGVAEKVVNAYSNRDAVGMINLIGDSQYQYDAICQQAARIKNSNSLGGFLGSLLGNANTKKCTKNDAVKSMQIVLDSMKGMNYSYIDGKQQGDMFTFTMRLSYKNEHKDINKYLVKQNGAWLYDYAR